MPRDVRDTVDLSSRPAAAPAAESTPRTPRPWISITWTCCSTYSRVYRNAAGTAYEGRCPRCQRPVTARIGNGGTAARTFRAG